MPCVTRRKTLKHSSLVSFALVAAVCLPVARAAEPELNLAQYFGFGKLEIFKLEARSANMCIGDLNHDGKNDLAIADNSHNRIDILQQRSDKPAEPVEALKAFDVNELGSDHRFEHRKIPVDKEISAMTLGDFNGDGRTDIAYFGTPDRLVIRLQPAEGEWTERVNFRLPDVQEVANTLAAGDLNHDGKDDLVVLGKNVTYLLYQQAGKLSNPLALMNTSASLLAASIADVDGDGRNDLSYLAQENREQYFCVRLQNDDSRLGPELNFDLKIPRAVTLADIDGKPGREILLVDASTNRVKVMQVHRPEAKPGELAGRLVQYGFGQEGADRDRDLAIGDLDGDGLADVVVTDPEVAQMIVYRQRRGRGLDSGSTFPGLVGASQIRMQDLDGNKTAEVVVLSTKEKTLAISHLENERLTFPTPLPVEGDAIAFDLADLNGDGKSEIVYVSTPPNTRGANSTLQALTRDEATGAWQPFRFDEAQPFAIKINGNPSRLVTLDANRDGRPDFLAFTGVDTAPQLYTSDSKGTPAAANSQRGIGLGEVAPGGLFLGELDQPAILAAWKNFARNLQVDAKGQWTVIDQYNAAESNAKIVGVATINLDGQPGNEVVLVDSGVGKLRVLRREMNLYRPWREVEIGGFPYKGTFVADLNGDANPDLLLFGKGRFGVLYAGQTDPALREVTSFETRLEKTFFNDVVAGDLNSDGRIDLAAVDSRSHFVEILDLDPSLKLRHALHFKLFEEKSIGREETPGAEPREALIGDVTGDGRPDLILLAHDRVLLYPQDDGKKATTAAIP